MSAGHAACPHRQASWRSVGGVAACPHCGTRRFTDYRALAHAMELPEPTVLCGPTHSGSGTGARHAALRARVREANRRSRSGRP
ncbi:DUF6255 family natural product biosynthesis protein [Streptomyces cinnamoneus]|uniref:DUF6255 family natural product biosynthesis protein n=1 Tax=Streptomyces cinnamoneus TaxID=53446 RepID=UPI0033EABD32